MGIQIYLLRDIENIRQ